MADVESLPVQYPDDDLYWPFFHDNVKFQYPPSSLLPFELLPPALTQVGNIRTLDPALQDFFQWASFAAVLVTILISVLILERGLSNGPPAVAKLLAGREALLTLGLINGLMWYPVLIGHPWGQVQVFLNTLIALSILL